VKMGVRLSGAMPIFKCPDGENNAEANW
jgi:hypothetical protein